MSKRHLLLTALPLFLLQLGTHSAQAQSQTWGTSVSFTPDLVRHSDGSNMPSTTVWTLGWFDDGFTPTTGNFTLWEASYNEVDRNFFIGQGDVDDLLYSVPGDSPGTSPQAVASVGKQMWIFAFNDISLIGTPAGEALLFTEGPARLFPASPSPGPTFDIADAPSTIDDNFSIVWGTVDRNMSSTGSPTGVLTGGGLISVNPGDNAFEAQTATWAVPEPTSALLLTLLGTAALSRRSRSRFWAL